MEDLLGTVAKHNAFALELHVAVFGQAGCKVHSICQQYDGDTLVAVKENLSRGVF